jgi:hypothetical protein
MKVLCPGCVPCLFVAICFFSTPPGVMAQDKAHRLAAFVADVTPPIGHPCMGGGIKPVEKIGDPLFAHGFVLLSDSKPIVVVAIDWCEIRNDAYERWRTVLAEAANTDRERVLVSAIHQHDAPIADLEAQRMLERVKAKGSICMLDFHEKAVQRVAKAMKEGLKNPKKITHFGVGQAKVEKVASNRRYLGPDGLPRFNRTSATRDPKSRETEEGLIDPWLKTLSFWDGERPILALSAYAVHPMSYYGGGVVSADFVGLARKRRLTDDPAVMQIYASGCSGNVTAGKYNDGAPDNRPILADRIYVAMVDAWKATKRHPITSVGFRSEKLRLEPRDGPGFTVADLRKKMESDPRPFNQCLAALGLSWRKRADAGAAIDVPALSFGGAHLVLLPAESYVEYQLLAQKMRLDSFVVVMGYGESAPGYIPTEQAVRERDGNLSDWNWVAPGAEQHMADVLKKVMK